MTLILKLPDQLGVFFQQDGIFRLSRDFLCWNFLLKLFGGLDLPFGAGDLCGLDLLFIALDLVGGAFLGVTVLNAYFKGGCDAALLFAHFLVDLTKIN